MVNEKIQSCEKQMEEILAVFSEYLAEQEHVEFIQSKNFGLLYVSLWSMCPKTVFDVMQIVCIEELCDILMNHLVDEYLSENGQICLDEKDIMSLYTERILPYIVQLPKYELLFHEKLEQLFVSMKCK